MENPDTLIAVFDAHSGAETAIKSLTSAGFTMKQLSVIGKGYHTEENVVGFYNTGDRVKFWGARRVLGRVVGLVLWRIIPERSRHRPCRGTGLSFRHGGVGRRDRRDRRRHERHRRRDVWHWYPEKQRYSV